MISFLLMVLVMSDQTRVEVRVAFPSVEACIVEQASITNKTRRYAGLAGASVTHSECKSE